MALLLVTAERQHSSVQKALEFLRPLSHPAELPAVLRKPRPLPCISEVPERQQLALHSSCEGPAIGSYKPRLRPYQVRPAIPHSKVADRQA